MRYRRDLILAFVALGTFATGTLAHANPKWMEQSVYPDTYLSDLTIPGTHDSGALHHYPLAPSGTVVAQDRSITDQLNDGVRFLDVRLALNPTVTSGIGIYHGPSYQSATGEDLLGEIEGFLDTNPNEVVLLSIKNEAVGDKNDTQFQLTLETLMAEHTSYFYMGQSVPRYAEARGKIVLIRRYPLPMSSRAGAPRGIDVSTSWPENSENSKEYDGPIWVSDWYHYLCTPTSVTLGCTLANEGAWLDDKIRRVQRALSAALDLEGDLDGKRQLRLTFASATIFPRNSRDGLIPQEGAIDFFAQSVNPALKEFADTHRGRGGVVIVDKEESGLIRSLIIMNAQRPFETGVAVAGTGSVTIDAGNHNVTFALPFPSTQRVNLGGFAVGRAAIALGGTLANNNLTSVFVVGSDGAVYTRWQTTGSANPLLFNSDWVSLGGFVTSNPVAIRNCGGVMEVYARGGDSAIWTTWQNSPGSSWHDWAPVGTKSGAVSRPVVTVSGCDLTVSAIFDDGNSYSDTRHNGAFQGWHRN